MSEDLLDSKPVKEKPVKVEKPQPSGPAVVDLSKPKKEPKFVGYHPITGKEVFYP